MKNLKLDLGYSFDGAFVQKAADPYSNDQDATVDIYSDGRLEVWKGEEKIVHIGPCVGSTHNLNIDPKKRRFVADLRTLALHLAERFHPGFMKKRVHLHPLEDNRQRALYFFRWDDFRGPLSETDMPPFFQVVLYADGSFASMTDSLSR